MNNPCFWSPIYPSGRGIPWGLIALAVICLPVLGTAAETAPEPPLLAKPPDSSAWTIDVHHKKARTASAAEPQQAGERKALLTNYPLLLRELVEKAGGNWHRVKYYDNQRKDEIWVHNGMVAFQFKNFAPDRAIALPVNASNSPAKGGFGPDFPELSWLEAKYFAGTVNYQGAPCYLYTKTDAKPLTGGDVLIPTPKTVAVSAWIDAKTRLPVAIESDEMVKKYSYQAGPVNIQPIGVFADALKNAGPHAEKEAP